MNMPMLTRRELILRWSSLFMFLVPITISALADKWRLPLFAAHFGVLVAFLLAWFWATRGSRRKLIESDFRFCLNCQYPLTGLDHAGTCPECGAAYNAHELERAWRDAYRMW